MSEQISEIHKMSNELLLFRGHYKSALRTVKQVLHWLRLMKFESKEESEFFMMKKSVELVYSTKFKDDVSKLVIIGIYSRIENVRKRICKTAEIKNHIIRIRHRLPYDKMLKLNLIL